MKKSSVLYRNIAFTVTFLLIMLVGVSATYAWFSSNRIVDTGRVTGRTNQENIRLLLGESDGANFQGKEVSGIVQLNKAATEGLMPVSSVDLQNFVTQKGTVEENAVSFEKVEEKYYFHGRVYLKAEAEQIPDNTRMAVYLDEYQENGGVFIQNTQGGNDQQFGVTNAARLGLVLQNDIRHILRLGEGQNQGRKDNTLIGGNRVGEGVVLQYTNGQVQAVKDPSESYTAYMVNEQGTAGDSKPLFYLEWNKVTPLDVYFYVEGCDPDCVDILSLDQFDFHLGLYGIMDKVVN